MRQIYASVCRACPQRQEGNVCGATATSKPIDELLPLGVCPVGRWPQINPQPVALRPARPAQNPVGLGDLVHAVTRWCRLDLLAQWYTRWTGRDCGCERRRSWLNRWRLWWR